MPIVIHNDTSKVPLLAGEVHVYVQQLTSDPAEYWGYLSSSEQARVERYRLAKVRTQFILARGWLRLLLGNYLDQAPTDVPIHYTDNGKPHLPDDCELHFNVSHTDGLAVFAFSRERVGIDVERQRPLEEALNLVERFFSPREYELFRALADDERPDAFFRAWTRKEAILKALGRGVQLLDCCDVTFHKDDPPQLLRLDDDIDAGQRWNLHAWEPAPGYVAALASERG